jgi:hypothetical protein
MVPNTSKHKSVTYYPASKTYVIEDENGSKTEIKKNEFIPYGPVGVASGGVLADNTTSASMTKDDNNKEKEKEKKLKQTDG